MLNFGAGFGGVGFELAGLAVVSLGYFLLGLGLFHFRHMRRYRQFGG